MSTATRTHRQRTATPDRWQSALRRSIENGVQVFQIASSGQWVATSASKPGIVHETDGITCTCEAAVFGNDPICQHRAAYYHRQGVLDLELTAEEMAAAAAIATGDVTVIVLDEVAPVGSRFDCERCEDTGAISSANRVLPGSTFRRPCPGCRAKNAVPTMHFRPRQSPMSTPIAA